MAKLYFKYGAMGSSKSAQALITKFNYEELGMTVWLIKPSIDTRDGADLIHSRIGLEAHAQIITPEQSIVEAYREAGQHDVIIAEMRPGFTWKIPKSQILFSSWSTASFIISLMVSWRTTPPFKRNEMISATMMKAIRQMNRTLFSLKVCPMPPSFFFFFSFAIRKTPF